MTQPFLARSLALFGGLLALGTIGLLAR